ncbi:hypothetical protein SAMN05428967_3014 [Phyllobacterium sp. YR620]|uniref:ACT domain-containing protein n=1 Tax=Phyllobacterium sp. YR620 TaxID=1881066 RepID=UPI0008922F10|nr:ACT domain-containing protein [Phyllobacterium sp. YR620]SDP69010.1 hypothetical protein SAMN05428967_3014 [Phyllobacterium sp. YR620]
MVGETDLGKLLATMRPVLAEGVYMFATIAKGDPAPAGVEPVMMFREAEGLTLIVDEATAKQYGLAAIFRSRMITLDVHSSLEAVGFLAAITACLAKASMGVNPVAGYYHDHLFVLEDRADEAMNLLHQLAQDAGRTS